MVDSSGAMDSIECLQKLTLPKEQWTPIDTALYTPKTFFFEYSKAQDYIFPAIRHCFNHHYENNILYHRICEVNGVTPESISSKKDLKKIPLLPDAFFKDYPDGKGFLKAPKDLFSLIW